MSKVKVRKMKMSSASKDHDINGMFNQMIGTGSVNLHIAYPRYIRIKTLCTQLVKLFTMFSNSSFMKSYDELCIQQNEIEEFCEDATEKINGYFSLDLTEYEWNLDAVSESDKDLFKKKYEAMKKSDMINKFIIICDRLVLYKKYIGDINNLNHKFINNMPGSEWKPFTFTSLNIKQVFSMNNISQNTIKFFMIVLNKTYELTLKLYEEISSPDIDIDQFIDVIMTNITDLKKRPELHRCKKAFGKITESVDLLKTKFNSYYRDFITTKDSSIMMEHFILDVSKTGKADPQLTLEFRKIIAFYRKMAQEQIKNPKMKVLFDKVNSYLKYLERGTENIVNINNEDEEGSSEQDESVDE